LHSVASRSPIHNQLPPGREMFSEVCSPVYAQAGS
jgi:hypothetical protein